MVTLPQGLESALDLLRSATSSGRISSALLLTDGVPNVEPVEGHLAALRRYQETRQKWWKSMGNLWENGEKW